MQLGELGQRIRSRREKLGLKQHDIAHALQVSPQAVSKWERGENGPDLSILGALATLLGVSTDWLLDTHRAGLDVFDATVLTSAIVGAYEKSRHMAARDFAVWANGFLSQVTEAVLRFDGVPIKYMGDAFLAFFSGTEHQLRACRAAILARRLVAEQLVLGLHSGKIYLGAMGHPDYARSDIVGEVVNVAFLTRDWAANRVQSGIAATTAVAEHLDQTFHLVRTTSVNFHNLGYPVKVCELEA